MFMAPGSPGKLCRASSDSLLWLRALCCAGLFFPVSLASAATLSDTSWIIAASPEVVRRGEPIGLKVVRPSAALTWPAALQATILSGKTAVAMSFSPDEDQPEAKNFRRYTARHMLRNSGLMQIELAELKSNRVLINVVGAADPVTTMGIENSAGTEGRFEPMSEGEPALSALEPVYLLAGFNHGLDARFQLSFKYRLFDPDATPVQWMPALGKLHFGYTQTSIWDLDSDSKPFHDTSYRPSLFWQSRLDESAYSPSYLRAGYEHESNGKDMPDSRSIDMLYVQPVLRKDFSDGNSLFFAPRFYVYLNKNENPDIARYRGYADWQGRYGQEHSWMLTGRVRSGISGYGSAQLDLSAPLRKPLFARTGGFFHFQVFVGYGESLLDYNLRSPPQLRIGYSIVR
jgi:outer membrane phospholipase A